MRSNEIKQIAAQLGFDSIGITRLDLIEDKNYLLNFIENNYNGEMHFLERALEKRLDPKKFFKNNNYIISVGLNYFNLINSPDFPCARIARYALGQDYHKILKNKLNNLAEKINLKFNLNLKKYDIYVDTAVLAEKALAQKAGLGFIGKNTLFITSQGSWQVLGELLISFSQVSESLPFSSERGIGGSEVSAARSKIYFASTAECCRDTPLDLSMELDNLHSSHHPCGDCRACIDACPTKALISPYQLDARKCLAYLTIEYSGEIPEEYRSKLGNGIYGCDLCQEACPKNKKAILTQHIEFLPKPYLINSKLIDLFQWTEPEFLINTKDSAISRINYAQWLRNIAIALGNAPFDINIIAILKQKLLDNNLSDISKAAIKWAIEKQNR